MIAAIDHLGAIPAASWLHAMPNLSGQPIGAPAFAVQASKDGFRSSDHGAGALRDALLSDVEKSELLRSKRNSRRKESQPLQPDDLNMADAVEKSATVIDPQPKTEWLKWYDGLIDPARGWLVPLITKSVTGGLVIGLGEILQCVVAGNGFKDNRILRWALLGALLVAPMQHFWFGWVAGFQTSHIEPFVFQYASSSMATAFVVLICALVDQLVFGPIINTTILIANAFCDKVDGSVLSRVLPLIWPAMKGNFILFFPAAIVNFALVPLQYRVLFINFICVLWGCYMAYISRKK